MFASPCLAGWIRSRCFFEDVYVCVCLAAHTSDKQQSKRYKVWSRNEQEQNKWETSKAKECIR